MSIKREKEEYLEKLWGMKEDNSDDLMTLSSEMNHAEHDKIIQELEMDDLIQIEDGKVCLTDSGEERARKIIRAHRLAEKLIFDALGGNYEAGACEFEHMVNSEMVDSICILLGHPRECPHGRPIPQGECCKRALKTAECAVIPLSEMIPQQSSRVAYINGLNNHARLNKIGSLQIRPGAMIRLEQKTPSFVIQCEGADIALDEKVAADIFVWKECTKKRRACFQEEIAKEGVCKQRSGFGFMRRWRGGKLPN
jgi:DtxR family Mn-dependent transcriptional regulator